MSFRNIIHLVLAALCMVGAAVAVPYLFVCIVMAMDQGTLPFYLLAVECFVLLVVLGIAPLQAYDERNLAWFAGPPAIIGLMAVTFLWGLFTK